MTSTVTVHVAPAAMVPFENEMDPAPATAVRIGAPQPVADALGVPATVIAAGEVGSVSENDTAGRLLFAFGLVMKNVSVLVPPVRMGFGPKNFEMLGGCRAVRDAVADPPNPEFVPPSVEEMNPLTFVWGPLVVAVTLTLTVQEPTATVAPVVCPKSSVADPATGAHEGAPPHVVDAAGVAAT